MPRLRWVAGGEGVSLPDHLVNLVDEAGHARPLEEVEADAIRFALSHYRNQMSEVARRLHIGRSTLYRKLDGLGLAIADEARFMSGFEVTVGRKS